MPDAPKQVQRIWPSAAAALGEILKLEGEGKKPSDFISQLILDYREGMTFPQDKG